MKILQFVTDSLGDASYLIASGDRAAVVDPQRDIDRYLAAASELGATIDYVFETHVHNDYLSGGRALAEAHAATVVAPRDGELKFTHHAVDGGDVINVGDLHIEAMAAPGHTYEHTAFLVRPGASAAPAAAFTGGAVLMGSAGRSDLLGEAHTEDLTRRQWETARTLATILPTSAELLPTHGAGSFCSVSGVPDRRGALAVELDRNPLFTSAHYDLFRAIQLASPSPIPAYYQYMAPTNRLGAHPLAEYPTPPKVDRATLTELAARGATVVDVRPRDRYLAGHLPGSLGIEAGGMFLAVLSWLTRYDTPIALVAESEAQAREVRMDLLRIGYEHIEAVHILEPGNLEQYPVVSPDAVVEALSWGVRVFDVRFANEQRANPLEGAITAPIEQILEWLPAVEPGPGIVVCGSGVRATAAAGLLARHGVLVSVLSPGGASEVIEARQISSKSTSGVL